MRTSLVTSQFTFAELPFHPRRRLSPRDRRRVPRPLAGLQTLAPDRESSRPLPIRHIEQRWPDTDKRAGIRWRDLHHHENKVAVDLFDRVQAVEDVRRLEVIARLAERRATPGPRVRVLGRLEIEGVLAGQGIRARTAPGAFGSL